MNNPEKLITLRT